MIVDWYLKVNQSWKKIATFTWGPTHFTWAELSQYTVFIKFRNMNDKIVSTGNTFILL